MPDPYHPIVGADPGRPVQDLPWGRVCLAPAKVVRTACLGKIEELAGAAEGARQPPQPQEDDASYCVLALTLSSALQREVWHRGEQLSINRLLEELGGIRETLVTYPRRRGQRQNRTATCLTRMNPLQQRLFSVLELQRYASITR